MDDYRAPKLLVWGLLVALGTCMWILGVATVRWILGVLTRMTHDVR